MKHSNEEHGPAIYHVGQVAGTYAQSLDRELRARGHRSIIENNRGDGLLARIRHFHGIVRKLRAGDTLVIHGASVFFLPLVILMPSRGHRIVALFYGSDYKYRSRKLDRLYQRFFRKVDHINLPNQDFLDDFRKSNPGLEQSKSSTVKFGLSVLDDLSVLLDEQVSRADAGKLRGYDSSRYIVMVGANASANHQQEEVLKAIIEHPFIRGRCQLVVLAQYGDRERVNRLLETAKAYPRERLIVETDFVAGRDLAMVRLAADAFVCCPIHDTFSGTVMESLYAGSLVVAGDWMPYHEMPGYGISILPVHSLDEIGDVLELGLSTGKSLARENALPALREQVADISSWQGAIPRWEKILCSQHADRKSDS